MKSHAVLMSLAAAAALALPLLSQAEAVFVPNDRESGFSIVIDKGPSAAAPIVALTGRATEGKGGTWVETRGNAGWVYVGHQYARRDGKWVCIDGIDHGAQAASGPVDRSLYSGS